MARLPTLLGLTLLLPLLLLPWAPTRAGVRKVVLLAPKEVNGTLGSTVILPCHLQPPKYEIPPITLIRWTQLDPLGDHSIVAEFHWELGSSIQERDRVEFKAARLRADLRDASLIIHNLLPEDNANYTCEISISAFQMGSVRIWLRVFYAPQVSISLYENIRQQGRRETTLDCNAFSNPEPRSYDWSTITGPLPPYAIPQGSQLLIEPTEEPISTTFVCRVYNELGTGQASMKVELPGSPREPSPSHSPWALRIILRISVIVFMAVLGILVYSQCRRQSRLNSLNHYSDRTVGSVSSASVRKEDRASEDRKKEGARGQTHRQGDTGTGGRQQK